MALASVAELKGYLDITKTGQDLLLQSLLDAVSARIESYTGRSFTQDPPPDSLGGDTLAPVTRDVFPMRSTGGWTPTAYNLLVQIPDARQITMVAIEGTPITNWVAVGQPPFRTLNVPDLLYRYFQPNYLQLTQLGPKITITGRFGFVPPPADIKDAALMMVARRYRERDASYGDAVQTPDGGVVNYFRQFPASVQATLDAYRSMSI